MQAVKKKRTKYVYQTSEEVLHLWANQSQDSARMPGRNRCYFYGTECYSYGSHYKLGELVQINGLTVALINTTGYSHTTSKHIRIAKLACDHLPIIEVDRDFDWEKGLLKMQDTLISSLFDLLNQRSFYYSYNFYYSYKVFDKDDDLKIEYESFNRLCETVGKPELKLEPDQETLDLIQEHIDFRIARQKELDSGAEERRLKRQAELVKKNAVQIEAWKQGGPTTNAVQAVTPQMIRVVGNEVQTSRGAVVPLNEAIRLARAIKEGKDVSGVNIGSYTINNVNESMITIGCHRFDLSTVDQLLNNTHLKLVK